MSEIKIGQRFRDAHPTLFGRAAPEWIVGQVFVGTDEKEYAEVYSAASPHERKTLSTVILQDKRRFVQTKAKALS